MCKVEDMLDSSNYYALYGKYKNGMFAYDANGKEIARTMKHCGYMLFLIKRSGDIDTAYYRQT